jgi:hypothetical protein
MADDGDVETAIRVHANGPLNRVEYPRDVVSKSAAAE